MRRIESVDSFSLNKVKMVEEDGTYSGCIKEIWDEGRQFKIECELDPDEETGEKFAKVNGWIRKNYSETDNATLEFVNVFGEEISKKKILNTKVWLEIEIKENERGIRYPNVVGYEAYEEEEEE